MAGREIPYAMNDLVSITQRLTAGLERCGVPYAVGGALALAYHAPPRGTQAETNSQDGVQACRPGLGVRDPRALHGRPPPSPVGGRGGLSGTNPDKASETDLGGPPLLRDKWFKIPPNRLPAVYCLTATWNPTVISPLVSSSAFESASEVAWSPSRMPRRWHGDWRLARRGSGNTPGPPLPWPLQPRPFPRDRVAHDL